jgi:hypothetical protein
MEDENNKAEETAETTSTPEINELDSTEVELDYDKEFDEQVEKFERAEKAREGYAKRKGTAEDLEQPKDLDIEAKVEEAIKKQLPKLQSTMALDNIEQVLNDISTNDAERKLIRFHFENTVAPNGTIRERLENAKLIANKKTILKTQKEMAVALQNRAGLSSSGLGTSTEGPQVQDTFFSKDQLNALKAKGWDDKKIDRLKANLRKQRQF